MTTLCVDCNNPGPLSPKNYCVSCTITFCAQGDGDLVGLMPVQECCVVTGLVWAKRHLLDTATDDPKSIVAHVNECFFCQLIDTECSECGTLVADLDPASDDDHLIVDEYVMVGCEGFHTAGLREAARRMLLETSPVV